MGVLLVCGGRDYADRARVFEVLDKAARRIEVLAVRHGAATGADTLADEWATDRGYVPQPFEAEWEQYKRPGKNPAGSIRNGKMLADGAVVACVAFPGGTGTADMVRRCEAARVPVWAPKR